MKSRFLVVALALALTACVANRRDMVFSGGHRESAMALIVADGMPTGLTTSEYYAFTFQRVDLGTSEFLPGSFVLSFEPFGAVVDRELRKPREMDTSVRFGAVDAPPGDYALVRRVDGRHMGGTHNCYTEGARVVTLEPGHVNIVALGSVTGPTRVYPEVVEKQVRAVLAGYPGVTAPLVHARQRGMLRFSRAENTMNLCRPESPFKFTPAG